MGEPQAQRRIIEFDIEKPFVHDSIEFVTLRIKVSVLLSSMRLLHRISLPASYRDCVFTKL